jgi:ABC-type uncharacterized transport system auxiliary subunit
MNTTVASLSRRSANRNGSKSFPLGLSEVASIALRIAAVLGLAGCGATRPMQYYQLSVPADLQRVKPKATGVSLALGPLVASHLYREDRIVYSSGPQQMGTYEFQRWTEPPAEMIQAVVLRELRASGQYRDVFFQRSNSRADYVLRGRLYDFKEVTANSLAARVTVEFELRDTQSGSTVWSHYYSHDEPVSGKDVPAMVAALDRNVQRGVNELKTSLEQYFSSLPAK